MKCNNCGVINPDEVQYCQECGSKLEIEPLTVNYEDKEIIKWKSIFLGIIIYTLIVVFATTLTLFHIVKGANFAYIGSFIGMILGTLITGYLVNKNLSMELFMDL